MEKRNIRKVLLSASEKVIRAEVERNDKIWPLVVMVFIINLSVLRSNAGIENVNITDGHYIAFPLRADEKIEYTS